MKSLLLALVLVPSFVFAADTATKKEGDRKPASLQGELLQSYLTTADVLSRARNTNQVCDIGGYQSEIIEILRRAQGVEGFSASMINADMRKALTGTIALQELLGTVDLYKNSVSEYQKALENSFFEAPGMGVYGPPTWMTLLPGGVVKVGTRHVLDQEPWVKDSEAKGTWGVQIKKERYSDVVRVWFKVNGKTTTYRLERSQQGTDNGWLLKVKKAKEEFLQIKFYNGVNSECEA